MVTKAKANDNAETQRALRQRRGMPPRVSRTSIRDAHPTPAFCKKSLDLLDCKGFDFFGGAKESARVCRERSYVVGSGGGVEVKTELT